MPRKPRRRFIPDDQTPVPFPPLPGFGPDVFGPTIPARHTFAQPMFRLWSGGPTEPAVDVGPSPDAASIAPGEALGNDTEVAWILTAPHPIGGTRLDLVRAGAELRSGVHASGLSWRPVVATGSGREWLEHGALVVGVDEVTGLEPAVPLGRDWVWRWDAEGITLVPLIEGIDVAAPAVPVTISPVLPGCPMRGGVDERCRSEGGPWTTASRVAKLVWEEHRRMLVDAFGCGVCGGTDQPSSFRIDSAVEWLAPRRGGRWGRGARMEG